MKTGIIAAVLIILVAVGGVVVWRYGLPFGAGEQPVGKASYSCDAGKTIDATYYKSKVSIVLGDGRKMELPQTISASGIRYANKDESFVFWSKGNTAFITEGSAGIQTYSNCVSPNTIGGATETTSVYASTTLGYSISYPQGYMVNEAYAYDQFGPKKLVKGVSFTIPAAMATGTNLSADTHVSVEELPRAKNCTADIFIPANVKAAALTDGTTQYSVASTSGAGAGNFYEETVYALTGSKPCTAVRYYVHSTNIGNYPQGAVTEYDKASLLSAFDTIRRSLVLSR